MLYSLEIPRGGFTQWLFLSLFKGYLRPTITGGRIMFIVATDHEDVAYAIVPPSATDKEGNAIPEAKLDYEVLSDNPDVVSITASADDPLKGTVHFGNPGQANINVNISHKGKLLGAFGAQFTTTVGDPAAIAGGGISFEGLSEAPTEPTELAKPKRGR
jgi:hypothetical protein